MHAMIRFVTLATILGSSLVQAQQGQAALEKPKHRIFSPNPPSCAAETVDNIKKLVDFSVGMIGLTTVCTYGHGWEKIPDYAWATTQGLFAPDIHNTQLCAAGIIGQIGTVTDFTAAMMAWSFDCLNENQACGQSITNAIKCWIDIAAELVAASGFCAPPGPDAADAAIQGFNCWKSVFHTLQRIVQAAKNIDVAIQSCNPFEFLPLPPLEAANGTGAGNDTAGLVNATELLGSLGPEATTLDDTADLGASWDALQQPQPYADWTEHLRAAPVERRLRASAGDASEGVFAKFGQLRAKLSELTDQWVGAVVDGPQPEGEEDDGGATAEKQELYL